MSHDCLITATDYTGYVCESHYAMAQCSHLQAAKSQPNERVLDCKKKLEDVEETHTGRRGGELTSWWLISIYF